MSYMIWCPAGASWMLVTLVHTFLVNRDPPGASCVTGGHGAVPLLNFVQSIFVGLASTLNCVRVSVFVTGMLLASRFFVTVTAESLYCPVDGSYSEQSDALR